MQRIWATHRLQPHRIRTFKRSNDPAFAEKVEDIVGLYMDPTLMRIVLQARAVEADSKPLHIEIAWNGKWADGAKEMAYNMVVKELP